MKLGVNFLSGIYPGAGGVAAIASFAASALRCTAGAVGMFLGGYATAVRISL